MVQKLQLLLSKSNFYSSTKLKAVFLPFIFDRGSFYLYCTGGIRRSMIMWVSRGVAFGENCVGQPSRGARARGSLPREFSFHDFLPSYSVGEVSICCTGDIWCGVIVCGSCKEWHLERIALSGHHGEHVHETPAPLVVECTHPGSTPFGSIGCGTWGLIPVFVSCRPWMSGVMPNGTTTCTSSMRPYAVSVTSRRTLVCI